MTEVAHPVPQAGELDKLVEDTWLQRNTFHGYNIIRAAILSYAQGAEVRFKAHTDAVAEWTSTVAEIIGLGENGKVTPEQILDQLLYGRKWASDMQTRLEAAEAALRDAQVKNESLVVALGDLYDKWENGIPCHEDIDTHTGFVGNAFKLTEAEENAILMLIPALATNQEK